MMVMKSAFDKDIFIPPSKVKEALTSTAPRPKFADNFRGCDWIQEVSVTIRKMKRTQIPKERYIVVISEYNVLRMKNPKRKVHCSNIRIQCLKNDKSQKKGTL